MCYDLGQAATSMSLFPYAVVFSAFMICSLCVMLHVSLGSSVIPNIFTYVHG